MSGLLGNRIGSVQSAGNGAAVGVNYGNIVSGTTTKLADVVLDRSLIPEELNLVSGADPVGRFIGRGWLVDQIDEQIAQVASGRLGGYVVVVAEAGVGKSALAAYLAFTRASRWPAHFSRQSRDPETARANLAGQIAAVHLPPDSPDRTLPLPGNYQDPAWFANFLTRVQRLRGSEPLVLLVDGLDEAPAPAAGEVAFGLPSRLPPGVVIVATTRPGHALPRGTRVRRIDVTGRENLDDLREYVTTRTRADHDLAARLAAPEVFVRDLLTRANGVWIYALSVIEQVRAGELSANQVDALPASLAGYYRDNMSRIRDRRIGVPVLGTLAAVTEPITAQALARWSGDLAVDDVLDFLGGPLRPFLAHGADDRYRLRHQSLRDFLAGQDSGHDDETVVQFSARCALATREAHARILDDITPRIRWADASPYALAYLTDHAAACGQLDRLALDPDYLLWVPLVLLLRAKAALTSADARKAVAARELTSGQDQRSLYLWALKRGADVLAEACRSRVTDAGPLPERAMWQGTTHTTLRSHDGSILALGVWRSLLVTGGHDGVVRLWDPTTLELADELHEHTGWITAITAWPQPNGEIWLVTADRNGKVIVRDEFGIVGDVDSGEIYEICVWPQADGSGLLVTGHDDGVARLWDADLALVAGLPSHLDIRSSMAVWPLPDGDALLILKGKDGVVRLWEPAGLTCVSELRGDFEAVGVCGRFLVTVLPGGDVQLRNYALDIVGALDGDGHRVHGLGTWTGPEGALLLLTANYRDEITLWNLATRERVAVLHGHSDFVRGMICWPRPHGPTLLASAGDDEVVRLWDLAAAEPAGKRRGHTSGVLEAATCPLPGGPTMLVTGGWEDVALLWHPNAAEPIAELPGHSRWVDGVTAWPQPGGKTLLVTADDERVLLWDPSTHQLVDELCTRDGGDGQAVTTWPRPGGKTFLVVADADEALHLWQPGTLAFAGELLVDNVLAMTAWRRSDGTSVLATVVWGGETLLWDPVSLENIGRLPGGGLSVTPLPRPDGRILLAAGGSDGVIRLFDPASPRLTEELHGHGKPITAVSPWPQPDDGVLLASGDEDGVVLVWDPAAPDPIATLEGHSGSINAITTWPHADGATRLVTVGGDASILIWPQI